MKNKPELLQAMMADQQQQSELYRPGPYWENNCQRIFKVIKKEGLSNFLSNEAISDGWGGTVFLDPSKLWKCSSWKARARDTIANNFLVKRYLTNHYSFVIQACYNKMKFYRQYYYEHHFNKLIDHYLDNYDLPDTLTGDCREYVEIRGKKLSINYVIHLMRLYNFSKHVDFTKVKTVFEIGGGYGANAHLLLHLYPNIKKYLYLEIAPMLYLSTQYLKHFYGAEVVDYLSTRNLPQLSFKAGEEREILAICPWQIEKVEADIDLFWNSASFQEMEPELVRNYCHYVQNFCKPSKGIICLAIYAHTQTSDRIPWQSVLAIAGEYFNLEEIIPSLEKDNPLNYYIGRSIN